MKNALDGSDNGHCEQLVREGRSLMKAAGQLAGPEDPHRRDEFAGALR